MKIFIAVIIAVLALLPAQARIWTGIVTGVTDGDTIWVKPAHQGRAFSVRIQGIDAPEICQDFGRAAHDALTKQVLRQPVVLLTKTTDQYGRVVARVSMGNQDIGAWLVTQGYAWSYHLHRRAGPYASEEFAARQMRRGLWAYGSPVEPRVFRKRIKCHKPSK